jgi:hypothetical protein
VRQVGIVAAAQTAYTPFDPAVTAPELAFDVTQRAVGASGLARADIDLTVTAGADILEGRSFGFLYTLEAIGAWPPVEHSHVESDGAFAAWLAWTKLLAGEADSALVVAWSKATEVDLAAVTNMQLDPFTLAPLGVDEHASAALQAAAAGLELGERVPVAEGACAVVLAAEQVAREACERPTWIAGADQRTEAGYLGHRDLAGLPAARQAADRARAMAGWDDPEAAELAAVYGYQAELLRRALGLGGTQVRVPEADPVLVTGLARLAEAHAADAGRVLAHATSGHALQHTLVWLLEHTS